MESSNLLRRAVLCLGCFPLFLTLMITSSCAEDGGFPDGSGGGSGDPVLTSAIEEAFPNLDLDDLPNYADQVVPDYITEDNTPAANPITDEGATLGRVLFYDKSLSADFTISCASCHQQEHAFSDIAAASVGVAGTTGRHSMRLVNSRFAEESSFFWDERAGSLEEQSTMPIQDHVEMGFSGTDGDPGIEDLIARLNDIDYYPEFFELVFGDPEITEQRMQLALAQFVRSIQSFDSKYDAGRELVNNNNQPFPNFSAQENLGKQLFMQGPNFAPGTANRVGGGAGCNRCHNAPEFDIDENSRNNGVVGVLNEPGQTDFSITRSPSLRDMVDAGGNSYGGFMHNSLGIDGNALRVMIDHYNAIPDVPGNTNLDPRLRPGGNVQRLNLTEEEKLALEAFMRTLTGVNIYTDPRWGDPFEQ